MMRMIPATLAVAAALLLAPTAQAAVVYAFQTTAGLSTYISPGFVTADTGPRAFGGCANAPGFVCQSITFDAAPSGAGAFDVATVRATDTSNGTPNVFDLRLAAGTLSQEGIHVINAANAMAVIEIGDYSPGGVLYLLTTSLGRTSVITQGFATFGMRDLQPDSCVINPPFDCGLMGFDFGAINGAPLDFVIQGVTGNGRRFNFGYGFEGGTISTPGIAQGRDGSSFLAVIPLPDPATAAVPEPATWALLLAGFGLAGAALRGAQRRQRYSGASSKNAWRLASAALVAALAMTSGASAATIVLNDTGGTGAGTQAAIGFQRAANFWGSMLTNNVTVNFDVGYASVAGGAQASTNLARMGVLTRDVATRLNANADKSALDLAGVANLPTLDARGNLDVITNGYDDIPNQRGANSLTRILDNDDSLNNASLSITRANARALGYDLGGAPGPDAAITLNSAVAFDFDPTDGIANDSFDFVGVAIREMGRALGFASGVDFYDLVGTRGPLRGDNRNFNTLNIATVLDLYRYASDPFHVVPGDAPFLDWSPDTSSYFSLDKGATMLTLGGRAGLFSTGQFNGDGRPASSWKDNTNAGGAFCSNATTTPIGIMDPMAGRCEGLAVTAMDLAAFDVIGWNTRVDVLGSPAYLATTSEIFGSAPGIPEPRTWALALVGFGLAGASLRRRRAQAGVAA